MRLRTIVVPTLFACGAIVLSCREATQIRVRVVTNLACPGGGAPAVVDTSVLAGPIGKVAGPIQAQTVTCEPGSPNDVGDIYVFPREEKDGSAEVWVVAGHLLANGRQKTAEECVAAYEGILAEHARGVAPENITPYLSECIIAKRRLAFVPHEALEITVLVDAACGGKACDPDSTCYRGTQCVPSDAVCDEEGTCTLPDEGLGGAGGAGSTSADASASNARVSSGDGSSSSEMTSMDSVSSQSGSGSMIDTSTASGSTGCEALSCNPLGVCQQCCSQTPPFGMTGVCGGGDACVCVPFGSSASSGPSSSSSGPGPSSSSAGPSSSSAAGGGPSSSSAGPSSSSAGSNCLAGNYPANECLECDPLCMSQGCFGPVGCIDSGGGFGGGGGGVVCTCIN